jgi:hypothetical protein
MIFILAGNHRQAEDCARRNHLPKRDWVYLHSREQLLGHRGGMVWYYGTWWERADTSRLEEIMRQNQFVSQTAPSELAISPRSTDG